MHIELPEKKYYKIGEVASAFGVNTSLIRFWEKEFSIIKPKKNAKGNRLFTPEDIQNFQLIFNLGKGKRLYPRGRQAEVEEKSRRNHQKS